MMRQHRRILLITDERPLAASLRHSLDTAGDLRLQVASCVQDAESAMLDEPAALVLLHLVPGMGAVQVDHLLWLCSQTNRPTPLIVIADTYLADEAHALFQMGVCDYLSREHHVGRIGPLVRAALHAGRARPVKVKGAAKVRSS